MAASLRALSWAAHSSLGQKYFTVWEPLEAHPFAADESEKDVGVC